MDCPRLLLIDDDVQVLQGMAETVPIGRADIARFTPDALGFLAQAGRTYAAVVCRAEHAEELAVLVRIRRARPDLPVVVLMPSHAESLREPATRLGASAILPWEGNPALAMETVARAMETGLLSLRLSTRVDQTRELTREILRLSRKAKGLVSPALGATENSEGLPVLICRDPAEADRILATQSRADVPSPIPLLWTVEQIESYLAGTAPFQDRRRFPAASALLVDIPEFPAALAWIDVLRALPEGREAVIYVLRQTIDDQESSALFSHGVTALCAEPQTPEGWSDFLRPLFSPPAPKTRRASV